MECYEILQDLLDLDSTHDDYNLAVALLPVDRERLARSSFGWTRHFWRLALRWNFVEWAERHLLEPCGIADITIANVAEIVANQGIFVLTTRGQQYATGGRTLADLRQGLALYQHDLSACWISLRSKMQPIEHLSKTPDVRREFRVCNAKESGPEALTYWVDEDMGGIWEDHTRRTIWFFNRGMVAEKEIFERFISISDQFNWFLEQALTEEADGDEVDGQDLPFRQALTKAIDALCHTHPLSEAELANVLFHTLMPSDEPTG